MASQRFVFLDVLRGFAVLWMIQVHVTNVMLMPVLRETKFFELLNLSNGFVAPAFIFCAGSGLWIALSRKGKDYLRFSSDLMTYLKRLMYVLFWAYSLHIPFFSAQVVMQKPAAELLPWLQFDVLQTIVYSSLLALVIFLLSKSLRISTNLYGIAALLIAAGTPFLWNSELLNSLPKWIGIAFLPLPHSPFPILPWGVYLFAGAYFTGLFMQAENKHQLARWFVGIGLVIPALIYNLKDVPPVSLWHNIEYGVSMPMMIIRVGGILGVFGLLYIVEAHLQKRKVGQVLQTMGRESLFLYITHLMIVYGVGWPLIQQLFGFEYTNYAGVFIAWFAITLPLVGVMLWWHRFKREKPATASKLLIVQVVWMILTFLITPAEFSISELLKLVQ
ncbi:MAG: DUF1624 domain-containing protein [Ignavibacteria bacterium]|nr:DUF1624 domain-containing protein [Ignavibacteria bacterium]